MAIPFGLMMAGAGAGMNLYETYQRAQAQRDQARDIREAYVTGKGKRKKEFMLLQKHNIALTGARGVEKDIDAMMIDATNWLENEEILWKNTVDQMDSLDTKNMMMNGLIRSSLMMGQGVMQQSQMNTMIDNQKMLNDLQDSFSGTSQQGYELSDPNLNDSLMVFRR